MDMSPKPGRTLWTIGHSNRTSEALVALLERAGMKCLVDIRRHPSSRRNPQFNQPVLAETLRQRGLRYEWMGEAPHELDPRARRVGDGLVYDLSAQLELPVKPKS